MQTDKSNSGDSLKLQIGKLITTWSEYPATRRELAQFPEGPPIFITGLPRSGTTWTGRMLAVPGVWPIHEPFSPNRGEWDHWYPYQRSSDRDPKIDQFMTKLLHGKLRHLAERYWVDHPLMPLRLLPQPIHRILIKDPIACLLSDYLVNHFPLQSLVVFRHPCGFVNSIIQTGWPFRGIFKHFLNSDTLMEDFLGPFKKIIESASDGDPYESAAVMHGCVTLILWEFCKRNSSMQVLGFEKLCDDPIVKFRSLFKKLNLPYDDGVAEKHSIVISNDSKKKTEFKTHDVRRNSADMAFRWRRRLKSSQIDKIRSVWGRFDVPLYQKDDVW